PRSTLFPYTTLFRSGRPYGEGFNSLAGVTAHAVAGPLSFDIQGEYQHAPGTPSDPPGALQAIAAADATLPFGNGISQVNRFDVRSEEHTSELQSLAY